jgi:hypothetical protein
MTWEHRHTARRSHNVRTGSWQCANVEARSCNHCCSGKAISITYCVCVFVALVSQHATRMRLIVTCGLSGYTIFFHISHKRHDFRRVTEHKSVFWFSLQLSSETFLIPRGNERDMIKNVHGLHIKYPLFLSDFNETWIFSTVFRKPLKYQIS